MLIRHRKWRNWWWCLDAVPTNHHLGLFPFTLQDWKCSNIISLVMFVYSPLQHFSDFTAFYSRLRISTVLYSSPHLPTLFQSPLHTSSLLSTALHISRKSSSILNNPLHLSTCSPLHLSTALHTSLQPSTPLYSPHTFFQLFTQPSTGLYNSLQLFFSPYPCNNKTQISHQWKFSSRSNHTENVRMFLRL